MKFLCTLPEGKHYRPLQSQSEGRWIWEDKATPLVRVIAPDPQPWGKEWVVLIQIQKTKLYTYQYPARLDLKCFTSGEDAIPAKLTREIMRGRFAYSQNSPHWFFCCKHTVMNTTVAKNPDDFWLIYSFN